MGDEISSKSKFEKFFEEKEKHRAEFVAAIIINLIFLYIFNNLLSWNLSFIAPTFADVLGILNLLIIATIIVNFIFIFYQSPWFRNLLQMIPDVLGINTAYAFLVVFPFILGDLLGLILYIFLVLVIIGSIIGLLIHLVKFVYHVINR